ncbi:hypothetical protein CSC00_3996 [Klebsiella pneumoniae]|nr:hypothetical protein CSC00_3996 [Klebsiella pneumoniae]
MPLFQQNLFFFQARLLLNIFRLMVSGKYYRYKQQGLN